MSLALLVVQEFNYIGKKIANTIINLSEVEVIVIFMCVCVSVCVSVCLCVCYHLNYLKTCNVTLMSEHMDLWILQRNSGVTDDMSRNTLVLLPFLSTVHIPVSLLNQTLLH